MALPAAILLALRGGSVAFRIFLANKGKVFFWALRHYYYSVSDRGNKEKLLVGGIDTYFNSTGFMPMSLYLSNVLIDEVYDDISVLMNNVDNIQSERALADSAQIIINSTRVGWLSGIGPEGTLWPENPEWYKLMKGTDRVLYGPDSSTIVGGKYARNYEFQSPSSSHMIDSMTVVVDETMAVVSFEDQAYERAEINELGLESTLILRSTRGGDNLEMDINLQQRALLGIAVDFQRLGSNTDDEHIIDIWSRMWDDVIGEV